MHQSSTCTHAWLSFILLKVQQHNCLCIAGPACLLTPHAVPPGSPAALGCQLCPSGTFSPGGTLDACQPCRFGFGSSSPGATSEKQCQKLANPCPAGSQAPANATSIQQCTCKPGFGTTTNVVVPGQTICVQVCDPAAERPIEYSMLAHSCMHQPAAPAAAMHSALKTHTLRVALLKAASNAALASPASQVPLGALGFQIRVRPARSQPTPRIPPRPVYASLALAVMPTGCPAPFARWVAAASAACSRNP